VSPQNRQKAEPEGSQELTTTSSPPGLLQTFGERHNIPAGRVAAVLTKTAFPDAKTEEQLIALLVIANAYDLDPFLKEIHAFSKDGRVFPMVGRDGWNKALRKQATYQGKTVTEADKRVKIGNSKPCPEWMECTIRFNNGRDPETVRVWFEEWFLGTNPNWNTRPAHMLRGQAIKQAAREAFGINLYDADDRARMLTADIEYDSAPPEPSTRAEAAKQALRRQKPEPEETIEDAVVVDEETGEVFEEMAPEEFEEAAAEAATTGLDMTAMIRAAGEMLEAEPEEDNASDVAPQPRQAKRAQKEQLL
jgi:phage recombination protein Bet